MLAPDLWQMGASVAGAQRDGWSMLDATAQAALVARGEATVADLVASACERIERLDPQLGAVPVYYGREALAAVAGMADDGALFRGVPFLMKDVGARQAGQPYYAGNRALREIDNRADADTLLGARFRELGLVTVGNSNSPEFALQSNTWPIAHGPTRNPWNLEHSAGGSSGGACAAVAAGLVPVAHASDGAGSIRIPAAWCGLIGLKPSRDHVAWRHAGEDRADVEFIVARSLRDTAHFLDRLRPTPVRRDTPGRNAAALAHTPKQLRIGVWTHSPAGGSVHPACITAVEETAESLRAAGHAVKHAAPGTFDDYEERALHGSVFGFHEYLGCLDDLAARLGREIGPEDVEPFLWELAHLGSAELSPEDIARATTWIAGWKEQTLAWFDAFDVLVTPTVCELAPRLDDLDPTANAPLALLDKMVPHMAFTEMWNATGQPAISLPLGFSESEGLPVGVQLVAGPGRDDLLMSLAARLLPSLDALPRQAPVHA